ncbi:MAG: leucine-rich repeat domain-containing protein [Bacteroidaceae bacterium]|nr:leucine-rich repeat domain-containing protein [Bacteroidaceae bacterium]
MKQRLTLLLMLLFAIINLTHAYTWYGTSGAYEFPNDKVYSGSGTITYTFTTKAGTEFFLSASSGTVYLDGVKETQSANNYSKSFSDNTTHTIKLSYSNGITVTEAVVKHPLDNQRLTRTIDLDEAGDLQYYLSSTDKYYIKKLIITGPMNGDDVKQVKQLANSKSSSLSILNLAEVQMKSGGGECGTYWYDWSGEYGDYTDEANSYTVDDNIGAGLFYGLEKITEITLPHSATSIGEYAFENSKDLEKVIVGNSTISIGFNAFRNCEKLKTVELPATISSIDSQAFCNCNSLVSINLPNSLTSIGSSTFASCSSLASIVIPEGVTYISSSAFGDCKSLKTVSFPSSLSRIERNAFSGCEAITRVYVTTLESWCSVNFGEGANPTIYSKKLYLKNSSSPITTLNIPEGVTSIGSRCFINCTGITSVTFPNTLTSVGASAFEGCTGIKQVNTDDIAAWCNINFSENYIYETILDEFGNIPWDTNGDDSWDIVLEKIGFYSNPLTYSQKLFYNDEMVTDLVIPEGVTEIGRGAFANCLSLKTVSFPETLKKVNQMAFDNCVNVQTVKVKGMSTWNSILFCSYNWRPYGIELGEADDYYGNTSYYPNNQRLYTTDYSSNPIYSACVNGFTNYSNIEWISSNTNVAEIDNKGLITAKTSGEVMIFANTPGQRNYCTLIIEPNLISDTYQLTISEAGMSTLYLDYPVVIPDDDNLLGVFYINNIDGNIMWMKRLKNYIPANTGVIVQANPVTITFQGIGDNIAEISDNQLSGVTERTPVSSIDGTVYTLGRGVNSGYFGFHKFTGTTIPANKAFLVRNASSGVNSFNLVLDNEDGTSTAIGRIENGEFVPESNVVYDLQGRRVENPSKGIYIVNGKKQYIK